MLSISSVLNPAPKAEYTASGKNLWIFPFESNKSMNIGMYNQTIHQTYVDGRDAFPYFDSVEFDQESINEMLWAEHDKNNDGYIDDDEYYAELEKELLSKINALGIGPQGFGGDTTALIVNIETAPTHIAGLPVAVNVGCHVTRHKELVL